MDYETGTRLKVTVLQDFDGCQMFTFAKGHQYEVVSGGVGTNAANACTHHWAAGSPAFTSTEWEVTSCEGDSAPLGASCTLVLPGCEGGLGRFSYSHLPQEPGETVQSALRIEFSDSSCMRACREEVPVLIHW